jgi:hypothetical protein
MVLGCHTLVPAHDIYACMLLTEQRVVGCHSSWMFHSANGAGQACVDGKERSHWSPCRWPLYLNSMLLQIIKKVHDIMLLLQKYKSRVCFLHGSKNVRLGTLKRWAVAFRFAFGLSVRLSETRIWSCFVLESPLCECWCVACLATCYWTTA